MYLLSVFVNNLFNKIFAETFSPANYFDTFKPKSGTPLETFYEIGEVLNTETYQN
ncbi:MAG: hypothetical protein K0Q49_636 [Haloplasmataceae bacterium]|jgi:hypothetical protein|nr:hypothetical protein [Haloplasmataceae bacterium]